MNTSGFFNTALLAVTLASFSSPSTGISAATSASLSHYEGGIETVAREINVAKEHRTAIITRMDEIGRQLDALDLKSGEVDDRTPDISEAIANADGQIASIQQQIAQISDTMNVINSQLQSLTPPTMMEDALGQSTDKHREIAVKKYQLYKTRNLLDALEQQQQALQTSKNSMFQWRRDISGSLSALKNRHQELRSKKHALENQFMLLTTTIVQKQDRSAQLKQRLQDISLNPKNELFSTFRGQLASPTHGVLRHRYAESKTRGMLQWDGIVISAPLGQPVSAVFDGNVVFADTMQGLGHVAIIDHGEGYMSLYGMTDYLIVEPGQYVLTGDTIGAVGNAPGDDKSSLYFEIRHNAHTIDPSNWLNLQTISQEIESQTQLY